MPLNRLTPSTNVFDNNQSDQSKAFYYPSIRQRELINPSSSNYYVSENPSEVEYSDYEIDTLAPSFENFESEKIIKKSSDNKKSILMTESSTEAEIEKLNNSQPFHESSNTMTNLDESNRNVDSNNQEIPRDYSKFLFSSPSATVTSNGPSVKIYNKKKNC